MLNAEIPAEKIRGRYYVASTDFDDIPRILGLTPKITAAEAA